MPSANVIRPSAEDGRGIGKQTLIKWKLIAKAGELELSRYEAA